MKSYHIFLLLICFLCIQCSTKSAESTSTAGSIDSLSPNPITKSVDEQTLLIHGKDVWVRDYPNTGKVVMKLNEGDICKVLQVGRYDVIRGKGSHWYQINFNDQTGWVFGSQTDKQTEKWEIMQRTAISKYALKALIASDFNELFLLLGNTIKKTEITSDTTDEDYDSKVVEINPNSISTQHSYGGGVNETEDFKIGQSLDMLQLWDYQCNIGAASMTAWGNILVVSQKDSKCSIVAELAGKGAKIERLRDNNYLIVSKYELFDMGTEQVGFINLAVYQPSSNTIIAEQQLGYCKAPKAYAVPFNYYAEEVEFDLTDIDKKLVLTITEKFKHVGEEPEHFKEGTSVRHYQFNEGRKLFEETGREEITFQ